jgi:hypothetical protein
VVVLSFDFVLGVASDAGLCGLQCENFSIYGPRIGLAKAGACADVDSGVEPLDGSCLGVEVGEEEGGVALGDVRGELNG